MSKPNKNTQIDWVLIRKFKPEPIGAIGFIGNDAVAVAAFFDDRDGNQDGKVSWGEAIISKISPISIEGSATVEVAMQARVEMDVILRDESFSRMATSMWLNFARGLVLDGIYAAYFARGVKMMGAGIAKHVGGGMVKELVIRKGFEKVANEAFKATTNR